MACKKVAVNGLNLKKLANPAILATERQKSARTELSTLCQCTRQNVLHHIENFCINYTIRRDTCR